MSGHHRRFKRWLAKLPEHTRYLVDQVSARIVPEFEARGFCWYDDFAGGDPREVAHHEIPLQRRGGDEWPTVQIRFDRRARPFFSIDFAALPAVCRRMFGTQEIPREKAIVVYAPAYFVLCKGGAGSFDGRFGYSLFALMPYRKIDSEIGECLLLLPALFELFDSGIPNSWLTRDFGYVDKHVMLAGSWHIDEKRREASGEQGRIV